MIDTFGLLCGLISDVNQALKTWEYGEIKIILNEGDNFHINYYDDDGYFQESFFLCRKAEVMSIIRIDSIDNLNNFLERVEENLIESISNTELLKSVCKDYFVYSVADLSLALSTYRQLEFCSSK